MEITTDMIKELRAATGAGFLDCRKALTEANGNLEKAVDWLREKGMATAAKRADREASQGIVELYSHGGGRVGVMVEVNCETDFVARNDEFRAFANEIAQVVARDRPADVATLSARTLASGETIEARRAALVQKIGENLSLRRFDRVEAHGRIASYVHGTRIGVLVDYTGGTEALGKDLAMHIAASKPMAVTREQVPADVVARERSIAAARAAESGKPANIVEKMVEGAVAKFLAEVTLLPQPFVKNDKETVNDVVKAQGARVNAFVLYVVGEGIEKRKDDFAAEVAAMTRN